MNANHEGKIATVLERLKNFFRRFGVISEGNFNPQPQLKKLNNIVEDRDVRNLIFNHLHINPTISDAALQREVLDYYGERYPDMSLNDWRHIIEDYTSIVREKIMKDVQTDEDEETNYKIAADIGSGRSFRTVDAIEEAKAQAKKLAGEFDGKTVIQHITIENHFENSIDTVNIHGEP